MFIKVAVTWLTTVSFVNNTPNFIVLIFTLQIFFTKYYTIVVYTILSLLAAKSACFVRAPDFAGLAKKRLPYHKGRPQDRVH